MNNRNPKLDLVTLIAPRLEFYYLEEWIDHYLSLGFDNIYIYNNGFTLCNSSKGKRISECNAKPSKKWELKPNMDHFDEYSEEEINKVINSIDESYNKVEFIPWEYNKDHNFKYPKSQYAAIINYLKFSDADFMSFLDVDEFMICDTKIKDFLSDKNFDSCKIYQYEQETKRRRKVKDIPISKEKYTKKCGKNISKVDSLKSLIQKQGRLKGWGHHYGFRAPDFKNTIETQEIYYNHYRRWWDNNTTNDTKDEN